MYKGYKCEVCGEVFLGSRELDECPFCSAQKQFLRVFEEEDMDSMTSEIQSDEGGLEGLNELRIENLGPEFGGVFENNEEHFFNSFGKLNEEGADLTAFENFDIESDLSEKEIVPDPVKRKDYIYTKEEEVLQAYKVFMMNASESEVNRFFTVLEEVKNSQLGFAGTESKE